jgi:predicted unusual protein kinase regulating ubiquinone biosynthesis (AarF/ABC1/UbiB family)
MATSLVARRPPSRREDRRRQVETVLKALGRPAPERRSPPPEGRLGADEDHGRRLRERIAELGPVFAGFGRYLASRADLAPRRARVELAAIPDEGEALPFASVAALVRAQLGSHPDRLFFEFHAAPAAVGSWAQTHVAWLAPGVPVMVTIVRPDAADELELDIPLLPLLAPWIDVSPDLLAGAVADYELTVRRRLDQRHQTSSLATLAADARAGGRFEAPVRYRDHCSTNILTVERLVGEPLATYAGAGEALARRFTAAWLRQAFSGNVVPYDFGPRDIVMLDDRLVLTGGALEPHSSVERARFAAYLTAVACDDPDAAANWILEGGSSSRAVETTLRRQLRQAVPFREGEWSGDDRLVQHVLVQWRVARDAGVHVSPHHLHLYRGLQAVAQIAHDLAPDVDALLRALEDERLRIGLAQVSELLDSRNAVATLDRAIQELADLPQKFDDVLTMAAQGRLRMKLQLPEAEENEHVRNRTVLLVTALVAFAAVAAILRHVAPALGVERVGALILLLVGGWLLFATSRL